MFICWCHVTWILSCSFLDCWQGNEEKHSDKPFYTLDDVIKPHFCFYDIIILCSDWLAHSQSHHLAEIFLIFTSFLSAERSQVIILSWTLRHTRRAFLFLCWTPYASSLPWPSQVPVRQDMSCWVLLQPVSIPFEFIFQLRSLTAGGSKLFV